MRVEGFDSPALEKHVVKLAAKGLPAVFMNYPIDEERDVETVKAFVDHVATHVGQWFYAPRPNPYLSVERSSLIGFNPTPRGWPSQNSSGSFKQLVKGILALLPDQLERPMRRLAKEVYGKLFLSLAQVNQPVVNKSEASPALSPSHPLPISLPGDLLRWPGPWEAWSPGFEIERRDLLDRINAFFPTPKNMHVILLNRCNLECVMCPYYSPVYAGAHTSGFFDDYKSMDETLFTKVAEYAGAHGISLQFGQIEEPMMHKKIFDFIKIAKQKGVRYIHMSTNGTLLSPKKAHVLAETGIDSVMFSIDAATLDKYKEIRGHDLVQLEENIMYFMPLAGKAGIRVTVSFVLQPQAIEERDAFLSKWRDRGVHSVIFYVLTAHDPKTGDMIRGPEHYDKGKRYPCASPWVVSVVFPDGEVSLCCKTMTDVGWRGVVSVGKLNRGDFDSIWRGERYRTVRRELLNNRTFDEFPVCSNCEIWAQTTTFTEEHDSYIRTYTDTSDVYIFR
jgi:MoaA/NifB/PqqE/SkfB family radical SAM enzyme